MAEMIDILMPESDEGTESVVERWLKKVGEAVTANEPLIEINTDKVSLEIPAPADGFLAEIVKKENEPVNPGDLLGRLSIKAKGESQKEKVVVPADMPKIERQRRTFVAGEREVRLSPIVRKMLAEHNIRPEEIIGSGRGGRITARDVENFIENRAEVPKAAPPVSAPSGKIPSHMVPHNALRRSTARHMVESMLNIAPHVTAVFDADLSGVVAHRAKNKAIYESKGVKLTFTAYFVHAAAQALLAVPEVNSRWHDDALEIFDECNIGVAAATDAGLIVPVLHRAEKLSLLAIAEQLQSLTEKARAGKLAKADVQNGTFTITNHGMTGSIIATPIINQPQSAILGIGKMEKRFVVVEKNGQDVPEIKPMAYVTLTIDHRALDGFQANQFLSAFVETLQSWR
ncbi:MAG: 2-oxo acid dehydrogenase subunit E2 [Calditrichaeota bacterium]|nr:2-oxo acid dehydrogenase subunit E2 [Calditrichota bacterium]MCB0269272.1 2-oxo acid dehydrogenase subunit E2 [Calditrichota bacterium]